MKEVIFEQIKEFVIEIRGRYRKELTRNTKLEADLGITGADGEEFIDAFFEKFGLEDPIDFHYSYYFGGEGIDFFGMDSFINKLRGLNIPKRIRDLSLGDLEKSAIQKKWIK